MSITERFERIERAYFAALAGRDPETVPSSVWRSAILTDVPDASTEEITEMFRRRACKASRGDGSVDLIKTLIDTGMCKDCAIRVAPLICTRAMAPEDCICSDESASIFKLRPQPESRAVSIPFPRTVGSRACSNSLAGGGAMPDLSR